MEQEQTSDPELPDLKDYFVEQGLLEDSADFVRRLTNPRSRLYVSDEKLRDLVYLEWSLQKYLREAPFLDVE